MSSGPLGSAPGYKTHGQTQTAPVRSHFVLCRACCARLVLPGQWGKVPAVPGEVLEGSWRHLEMNSELD